LDEFVKAIEDFEEALKGMVVLKTSPRSPRLGEGTWRS
jgi:hypothetical protein